jgi:predicted type IV restriction endonuclease
MDLADKIRALAARIPQQISLIQTEEATKNALIMPFIAALGYDVFDPSEVTPELVADVGIKKGEKVDYAILKNSKPIILFECKAKDVNLNKEHASQLHRYFHATEARFGILTNGIQYKFFTDLEKANMMDSVPFFEIDMLDLKESDFDEIRKFAKSYFDLDGILSSASELKYLKEIKKIFLNEYKEPSEKFIRLFSDQIYSGRFTQNTRDVFSVYVSKAFRQFINEQISDRLQTAFAAPEVITETSDVKTENLPNEVEKPTVDTTQDEKEGFLIIRAILRQIVEVQRVAMRDVQSYCGILLDDNNRKPIIRFYFSGKKWQIGIFDNVERKEEFFPIESLNAIYDFSERIINTVRLYETKQQ